MITRFDDTVRIETAERSEEIVEYAVGDVHGCLDELRQALDWCAEDALSQGLRGRVHLLGDYVDRGPDSKGVLDLIKGGSPDCHMSWMPLMGNHDEVLSLAWKTPHNSSHTQLWWDFGGQQTLASFGWNPVGSLPAHLGEWIGADYVEYVDSLPHMRECGDLLFVHAGVRPGVALREQKLHDVLYIRGEFMRHPLPFGHLVVHGHTPHGSEHPKVHSNRVALDSACFATGNLSVAAFDPGRPFPRLQVVGRDPREIPAPDPCEMRYR